MITFGEYTCHICGKPMDFLNDWLDQVVRMYVKVSEEALTEWRALCDSDEEFSNRMKESKDKGQPKGIYQYFFDEKPAFYVKIEFEESKLSVIISAHAGRWKENINA